MHQTIADYARLHLRDESVYERFIAYFTDFTEEHKKDYELLEQESNLILATLETAYELGKWDAAGTLCLRFCALFISTRHLHCC